MRINDLKMSEERDLSKELEKFPPLPKLDDRQLLAALFNRNYYDTEEQLQDFPNNGIEFVN